MPLRVQERQEEWLPTGWGLGDVVLAEASACGPASFLWAGQCQGLTRGLGHLCMDVPLDPQLVCGGSHTWNFPLHGLLDKLGLGGARGRLFLPTLSPAPQKDTLHPHLFPKSLSP